MPKIIDKKKRESNKAKAEKELEEIIKKTEEQNKALCKVMEKQINKEKCELILNH